MVECRVSRVEGHRSRVEGYSSRVEGYRSRVIGRVSKVEVEGQKSRSRVKSRGRGSKMGNISFLLNISKIILHFWHLLSKF